MDRKKIRFIYFNRWVRGWIVYALNLVRYGPTVPAPGSIFMISPRLLNQHNLFDGRKRTGMILSGDWDLHTVEFDEMPRPEIVKKHIHYGSTWFEAGAYEFMKKEINLTPGADECFTELDIIKRYENLENFIILLRSGGKFLSRKELGLGVYSSDNDIVVNIGREGNVMVAYGGHHRLAIARSLGLDCIPITIGVIHAEFFKCNKMDWKKTAGLKNDC